MPRRYAPPLDPLIAPDRQRLAWGIFGVCAAVVLGLGAWFHGQSRPTAFDRGVDNWIADRSVRFVTIGLRVSEPRLVLGLFVALAICAGLLRRWDAVLLAVLTPLVSVFVIEIVLKPLVDRTNGEYDALVHIHSLTYPSGHESGIGSFLAVLALLLLRSRWPVVAKVAGTVGVLALLVLAAIGLVGNYYHYATDTIGSLGVVVATVIGLASAIDAGKTRLYSRRPVTY